MSSLLQSIGRKAVKAFSRDTVLPLAEKSKHFRELEGLLSGLTSADLCIDHELFRGEPRLMNERKAPVTYVLLYEDNDVNICVFILKKGVKMPMHDHPGMCGLLKVVHGNISVQSYSLTGHNENGIQSATKHAPTTKSNSSSPLILTAEKENLHEICSLDGPAAFLDILSPPYGDDPREGCERDCHYYREVDPKHFGILSKESNSRSTWLQQVPSPRDFWCDQAYYRGPKLGHPEPSATD